ncbi:MAG TPA: hypothetical protein VJS92_15735 [Candidatus Polarisedimenticolaceae bacterium]|nr:hypothetical protein [Candidatus Polarisedimenticolaceae bacterium]
MTRQRAFLLGCTLALEAASVVSAAGRGVRPPQRFVPRLDSGLVVVGNVHDGSTWAAWSYRDGSDSDIAISVQSISGIWSDPFFVGRFDGIEQLEPALASDAYGTVYLAYAESSGRVVVRALTANGHTLFQRTVTPEGVQGRSPALLVSGEWLIVAYADRDSIAMLELPLVSPLRPNSIVDGPDPATESSGSEDDGTPHPTGGPVDSSDEDGRTAVGTGESAHTLDGKRQGRDQ